MAFMKFDIIWIATMRVLLYDSICKSVGKRSLFSHSFARLTWTYRKMSLWRTNSLIGTAEFFSRYYIMVVGAPRFKQNGFQAISTASKCFGSSKMDSLQFFRYKRDCEWWDAALAVSFVIPFARSDNWRSRRFRQIFFIRFKRVESSHA